MKTRNGFVSNSSTSSFICEICGNNEAGSDSCSMYDYGFMCCENGHEFDIKCINEYFKENNIECDIENEDVSHEICPICNMKIIRNKDLIYYMKKGGFDFSIYEDEMRYFGGNDIREYCKIMKEWKKKSEN